jgi:NAD+ synthase (glutamine-hydrolysing)
VVFAVAGVRFGLLICEDAWFDEPAQLARAAGAQVLCVLNASPFHPTRPTNARRAWPSVRASGLPLLYAHLVGGQDEVVFDGASFAVDAQGRVAARALAFAEDALTSTSTLRWCPRARSNRCPVEEQAWAALVTGVRDYVGKNGFPGAIIGLSGGIDSALVLAMAVDALGADRCARDDAVALHRRHLWIDARDMAQRLGVRYDELAIAPMFDAFRGTLAEQFAGLAEDATEENLQARIRGTLLMALSNKFGWIVLTTGNKSEMATGYCTLYGDMAGGFAVIKDVAKTLVYRLASGRTAARAPRRRQRGPGDPRAHHHARPRPNCAPTRPTRTACRPTTCSTASWRATWKKTRASTRSSPPATTAADVEKVTRLIKLNEYKRRQAPVGIRITHRAFGRDWRYPITSKFRA